MSSLWSCILNNMIKCFSVKGIELSFLFAYNTCGSFGSIEYCKFSKYFSFMNVSLDKRSRLKALVNSWFNYVEVLSFSSFNYHSESFWNFLYLHCVYDNIQVFLRESIEHKLMSQPFTNLLLLLGFFFKNRRSKLLLFIKFSKGLSRDWDFLLSVVHSVKRRDQ